MVGVILIILLSCLIVGLVAAEAHYARQAGEPGVREKLLEADRQIDAEFKSTRQAMNDAAGQSWRNLTE